MKFFIKHKQKTSIFLLLIMLIGLIPIDVLAINNTDMDKNKISQEDMFIYEDKNKEVLIGFKGEVDVVKIPDQVKRIKNSALKDKNIKILELNEGLEVIESEAFSNNQILGNIILPSTLNNIGERAFADNLIQKVDFSKAPNLKLGRSAFQDNKISGKLDISNLKEVPAQAFWNNEITDIVFNEKVSSIGNEAFANNKLSELSIVSNDVVLGEDVFAGNGRYVTIFSNIIKSEKSKHHQYGHIINPVSVRIRAIEKSYGADKQIQQDKVVKFDPYDANNFFTLNERSFYKPEHLIGYTLDKTIHQENLVPFTPTKDGFILNIYYNKIPGPTISVNSDKVAELLSSKKEGSNITEEELLGLVSAEDSLGLDISKDIKVSPKSISNAEQKEYEIFYSVADRSGKTAEYVLTLPIDMDPLKIRVADTEWQLEDFIYNGNSVINLSDKGKEKAKKVSGIAIPHINPYTMEPITIVDFKNPHKDESNIHKDVREGPLVFGNPEIVEKIGEYSFSGGAFISVDITGELPDFPNLKYLGKDAFLSSNISGKMPKMPKLEYIGDNAFYNTKLTGELIDMPNLEYIGFEAFRSTLISGKFPNIPKIKHIGNSAFTDTKISGQLPDMPELEHIGEYVFRRTNINGTLPAMPKVKYIGTNAFSSLQISGDLPYMPELEYIGWGAFYKTNITGTLEEMSKLKHIRPTAFYGTKISGQLPYMPELKEIGSEAFYNTSLEGPLPDMPNLEHVGTNAFYGTKMGGELPAMPKVKYIGKNVFAKPSFIGELPAMPELTEIDEGAFKNSGISGVVPSLPNLKEIGEEAFINSSISGQLPEMPNLEHIGDGAFRNTKLSGVFPSMPNLKSIGESSFRDTTIGGKLPELPNLIQILDRAFNNTHIEGFPEKFESLENFGNYVFLWENSAGEITDNNYLKGDLPEMPKIKYMGEGSFYSSNISKDKPFYINNDTKIQENTFTTNYYGAKKQLVLLTHDGKDAPGVPLSEDHILNPYNIGFVGKDSSNNIIFDEKRLLATEDGENIIINIPRVEGFVDRGSITVPKSDLVDGVYTHIYKSIKEELNENGGNKYQFSFNPTNSKVYYNDNETINAYLSLSTVNEEVLKNGQITLVYDKEVYKDFFIPEIKGVSSIEYNTGEIIVNLDKNLSQGTEIGLPVSFQFKEGVLPEKLFSVEAYLYNEDLINGYEKIEYGINYKNPVYKSTYSDKNKTNYENIIVESIEDGYTMKAVLYPEVDSFIRNFDKFRVEYDHVKYINSAYNQSFVANPESPWKSDSNKGVYYYEIENFNGQPQIPPLVLNFTNPMSTDKALTINSKVIADVNTSLKDYQYVELKDTNYLNIHVEERSGDILSKEINNPHSNNRQSYFYDNLKERSHDFEWNLYYNITQNTKELTLIDYELDNRMKYTAINPNNEKTLVKLLDKDGNILLEKTIREKTLIDEDLQDKVKSIELRYFNLKKGAKIRPKIITNLKDVEKEYFNPLNPQNINRFHNKMRTKAISDQGIVINGEDYSFVDVVGDNKLLSTEVNIVSKPIDLSYGKVATSSFYLKSEEYFEKNIEELRYTALIDPAHRLEDVLINPNFVGNYEISQTPNGYTKVDFIFTNSNIRLNSYSDKIKLFDLKTTPKTKSSEDLVVHGLLSPMPEYEIYNKGIGFLEGLDKSKFSYDEAQEKIINGEFFSIQKLIGKGEEVSTRIETEESESFFYRFEIDNGTTTRRENFELIDILPYDNDFNNSHYHNKVDVEKLKNIKLPDGFNIQYLNQKDFINIDKNQIMSKLSNANWSNNPTEETKAIRITANILEAKGDVVKIDIPMKTKSNLKPEDNSKINRNQFAYTHKDLGYSQALSNPVDQVAGIEVPKKDIKLKKVSHIMGIEDSVMEGIRFTLKDSFGKTIDDQLTDSNGELVFKNIPVGDYIIEETFVPEGYKNRVSVIVKAEDMNSVSTTLDLGKVINNRIDEFDFLLKNVEVLDDLSNINYSNLKNIYNREIMGSSFVVRNIDTDQFVDIDIDNRFGETITLSPGKYIVEQTVTPKDNGLSYKENNIKYMFEIDKFGKIHISSGKGDTLKDTIKQISNVIYFPNTIDYPLSKIEVFKNNRQGDFLSGAEFTLTNINTGELLIGTTNSGGILIFEDIKPGLYSLKETKAPNGYIATNQVEIVEIPMDRSITAQYKFMNEKLVVNIHKYKVVADRISTKEMAEEIANNTKSYTNGNIIIKDLGDYYQVREVWKDNNINVNGTNFKTNSNGSTLNIQETLTINKDSILNISNNTKIPAHYEPGQIDEYIEDYVIKENFDGTIDIDIIVKPLKGSIYVSKYVIDKNNEVGNKEFVNGSKYDLYVDKGNGYELLDNKTIENNNYLLFKDLNPLYKYKVVETFTPEGQEEANPKEYEVVLRDDKSYVETVIFRNYIELEAGSVHLNKVDGRTNHALQGVEFEIIDKYGVGVKHTTDSQGNITFEDLRYDLAPYTIRETKAAPGYRISSQVITVTEEDILNEETFTVKNYKYNETPKTGTSGKIPFFLISIPLIVLAYIFNKKKY